MSAAIEMAKAYRPRTVLEIGFRSRPIFKDCETMDIEGSPAIIHDATCTPWPFADKRFDLIVALQVWEHLFPSQRKAFREVVRCSRAAVLSFPFMWDKPGDIHHQIGIETIMKWTLGMEPDDVRIVNSPNPRRSRIVYSWSFSTT